MIKEYANFGSVVYAPITRDGLPLDKKASKYEVQPDALLSYNGVTELANTLQPSLFKYNPMKIKSFVDATCSERNGFMNKSATYFKPIFSVTRKQR